jgi:asparagine synthase (glutamine-hydrolysing)
MCGIAGIVSFGREKVNADRLRAMNQTLIHRGPESGNIFISDAHLPSVGLAHRRLSIIDLSDRGIQPMFCYGRYHIIHNGEIYNYKEIKEDLIAKGLAFTTETDTEVIAAAWHYYGRKCLTHFDGMFAFAIWDNEEKELFCARDRFGEKPFYYHYDTNNKELVFASEMKALWAAGISKKADYTFLFQFITTGQPWIMHQPDRSGYENIFQLPPSNFLYWQYGEDAPAIEMYFDIDKTAKDNISANEAAERFRDKFYNAVSQRLRSDVQVGTSISGGLDSSSIIAACNALNQKSYSHQGFSALFPGFEKNEEEYIHEVATKFSIHENLVMPDADGLAEEMETLFYHQEIPFSSSSVYAQYKVFELANEKNVTVLLDGQGADEIAAGYPKYTHWYLQERVNILPYNEVQREAAELMQNGYLEHWGFKNYIASKLPGLTALMLERRMASGQQSYPQLHPQFKESYYDRKIIFKPAIDTLNDVLYNDTMHGGLKELLHYADRNAMAFGREVRLPFLQHGLVTFLFSLPPDLKFRDGFTKWIIRKSFESELPAKIVWRKSKTGFEPPQKDWMQHEKVKRKIIEAKELLVDKKILKPDCLKKDIIPSSAYDSKNADWRFWMAGLMLKE